jgi:hypothetical protein
LVISNSLTGPIGLFVRFSTLQEYGVDKVFVLENGNTDSSQRNIVFLVHGEKAPQVQATAGTCSSHSLIQGASLAQFFSLSAFQTIDLGSRFSPTVICRVPCITAHRNLLPEDRDTML